ncbi:MAG: glucose 1-dehydrogenase [Alphaproteobacteria bacterium]|nr:glucose 1-dehydrogenase [Alphaproteobacteria bacterium]
MRVAGKVALVSGGAHGMGAAMAKLLASEGAKVVIGDLLESEGADVVKAIEEKGGAARFHRLDVRAEDDWRAIVAATIADFGRLDILVNNAGISGSAVEDFYDTPAWEALMSINATGVFLGMKYGIAAMKRAGGGAIVNISSISGVVGQDFIHMGYNASKGAVRLMTKSAAAQHGRDNIRVNSVHPGLMPPMRTSGRTADPQRRAEMLSRVPLGRSGRAEEVAHAVLFLASDDASYITGAELHVDGGYLAT